MSLLWNCLVLCAKLLLYYFIIIIIIILLLLLLLLLFWNDNLFLIEEISFVTFIQRPCLVIWLTHFFKKVNILHDHCLSLKRKQLSFFNSTLLPNTVFLFLQLFMDLCHPYFFDDKSTMIQSISHNIVKNVVEPSIQDFGTFLYSYFYF